MNIYTYGSLRLQKIWDLVTARTFETCPAVLEDHVALKVNGQAFPGLVKCQGQKTEGLVHLNVDPQTLGLLDTFESDFYHRVAITALLDNGTQLECETYLVQTENQDQLLDDKWDFDEFCRDQVDNFIANNMS